MKIGILSDTHLYEPSAEFQHQAREAFSGCSTILHAGDLVHPSVLEVFEGKTVHAVHGNMCGAGAREALPASRLLQLGGLAVGLAHGHGLANIEDGLWSRFPEADVIVYGHTHRAVCHRQGPVLFINPGSFRSGTAAILEIEDGRPRGRIIQV